MGSTTPDWVTEAVQDGGGTALNFSDKGGALTDDLLIPLLHEGLTELDFRCCAPLFAVVSVTSYSSSEIRFVVYQN